MACATDAVCGRYAFFAPREAIERVFGVADPPEVEARYNVAPTQAVAVVCVDRDGRRVVRMQRWGLVPFWARDLTAGARMINARAETLSRNAAFRAAFEERRCIVPVSGFYEWHGEGRARAAHYIERADGEPFALAGLWAQWRARDADPDTAALESCTIITTSPNALIAPLHDRMPVILPAEAYAEWLDPRRSAQSVARFLQSAPPEGYREHAVSRAVNDARNEGPELIRPL